MEFMKRVLSLNRSAPWTATARFVKLVALSGYVKGPWAVLAEFNLIHP